MSIQVNILLVIKVKDSSRVLYQGQLTENGHRLDKLRSDLRRYQVRLEISCMKNGERPIDFDPGMAWGSWGESSRESCEHFEQPRQWQRQQSAEIFSVRWGRELEQVKYYCHNFVKFHGSLFSRSASDSSVNHNKNLTSLSSQGWVITWHNMLIID